MQKITKTFVEALKPANVGIKGSNQLIWDNELRGFGVSIGSKGTKSFVVQYRTPLGKTRRKVIGRYGLMTAEQGRRAARVLLGEVAKGTDPVEEAKLPALYRVHENPDPIKIATLREFLALKEIGREHV